MSSHASTSAGKTEFCVDLYIPFGWSGAPAPSQLVLWDDPEEWYGDGGGRGVQNWEHVYTHGRFMLMYGKTNTIL